MRKTALLPTWLPGVIFSTLLALPSPANAQTQLQVYGLWHCSPDACSWASVPNMTTFDTQNHWIIDRGNGSPSVNLVVPPYEYPNDKTLRVGADEKGAA